MEITTPSPYLALPPTTKNQEPLALIQILPYLCRLNGTIRLTSISDIQSSPIYGTIRAFISNISRERSLIRILAPDERPERKYLGEISIPGYLHVSEASLKVLRVPEDPALLLIIAELYKDCVDAFMERMMPYNVLRGISNVYCSTCRAPLIDTTAPFPVLRVMPSPAGSELTEMWFCDHGEMNQHLVPDINDVPGEVLGKPGLLSISRTVALFHSLNISKDAVTLAPPKFLPMEDILKPSNPHFCHGHGYGDTHHHHTKTFYVPFDNGFTRWESKISCKKCGHFLGYAYGFKEKLYQTTSSSSQQEEPLKMEEMTNYHLMLRNLATCDLNSNEDNKLEFEGVEAALASCLIDPSEKMCRRFLICDKDCTVYAHVVLLNPSVLVYSNTVNPKPDFIKASRVLWRESDDPFWESPKECTEPLTFETDECTQIIKSLEKFTIPGTVRDPRDKTFSKMYESPGEPEFRLSFVPQGLFSELE